LVFSGAVWLTDAQLQCWGGWKEDDFIFAIIGRLDADPQYTLVGHLLVQIPDISLDRIKLNWH